MSNQPSERENPYEPAEPAGTDEEGRPAQPDSPYEEPTAVQPGVNDEPAEGTIPSDPAEDTAAYEAAPTYDDAPAYEAAPADDAAPADPAPSEPGPGWDEQDTRPVPAEGPEPGRDVDPDSTVTSTFDVREAGESGVHEAERPVPRSGLAEHNSAGYLTGERRPVEEEAAPTTQVPVAADETPTTTDDGARDESSGAWIGGAGAAASTAEPTGRSRRDVVLDGTTAVTRPPSRAGAHVLTILVTLLLTPVAWYLLADAGARLTLPARNPWDTGNLNIAALLELAGGLLVLAVVLLAARWSSVGAIVTGILVVVLGVPFLAAPTWTQEILEPVVTWLDRFGDFGGNVAHHLVASGATGRLVVTGLTLVLVGVVSHGARRKGRREVTPVVETV